MNISRVKSNLLLLLTAFIWGLAFVFQREGMEYVGPFTFTGVRFVLGAVSILPLILFSKRKPRGDDGQGADFKTTALSGFYAGLILFVASTMQQIGLMYTTAGKAAFITALYMVFVPFFGLFLKQKLNMNHWLGAIIAVVGLYFLCVTESFSLSIGDLFELTGALFWAAHILIIDKLSRKTDVLKLSLGQIVTCCILSLLIAVTTESIHLSALSQVIIPLVYGGVFSVGVAYTLQVVGQKNAHPTQAAIIFCMESVFAAIGGYLFLNEQLGSRGVAGCLLMLVGLILAQLPKLKFIRGRANSNCGRG